MMQSRDELIQLATALGQALGESPEAEAHRQAQQQAQADPRAGELVARLDALDDGVVQRQAAGEILSGGEIDAYYDLERQVHEHPALAGQARALERVKDLFTETHSLLTNELGINLQDLIK